MNSLDSFSRNAADLIRLHRALCGTDIAQQIMLRCFRRSKSEKINEATVCAVLQEMDIWIDDDGNTVARG